MPISPDVFYSTLEDLRPKYEELFTVWHPLLDKILNGSKIPKERLEGPYRTFTVVTGGPGSITKIPTGSEIINGGRRQTARKGKEIASRMIYAYDVPSRDLAMVGGKMDLGRLLQDYPENALSDFHERFARQLVLGDGEEVDGILTFNGLTTYDPDNSGARDGVFSFEAPDLQDSTVHELVKEGGVNGVRGWYNQFGEISSFQTDGRKTFRETYYRADSEMKTSGPVDLILADPETYSNYLEALDEKERIVKVKGETLPGRVRSGIPVFDADMFQERAIDLSADVLAGSVAAEGLAYGLKTSLWEIFTLGRDARATTGWFVNRPPIRPHDQDAWRFETVYDAGIYCRQLRSQFAICGGARP